METKSKTKKVVRKTTASNSGVKKTTKRTKPTFEQIQSRAYQIYVENGYRGNEMENWLKAEKELK